MRATILVALAAALSWGHAVATAGEGLPGAAHARGYVAALDAARALGGGDLTGAAGGGVLAAWAGGWLALLGASPAAFASSYLPFHAIAAVGLWWGGRALGGAAGGTLSLTAGLAAAGVLTAATQATPAFPVLACFAYAAGAKMAGRPGGPAMSTLGAMLLGFGFPGASLGQAWPVAPVEGLVAWAQPALLAGVIAALLLRGDAKVLRLLGVAAVVFGAGAWAGLPSLGLAAVPALAIATAGVSGHRAALGCIGVLALVQLGGFHADREGWPGRPVATRPVAADPSDAETVARTLDWLAAHGAGDVAAYSLHARLDASVFAVAAAERGLALRFVAIDAANSDLGLVLRKRAGATPREGWRTQLPPAAHTGEAPGGYVVELWDRGLPPESLLGSPEEAEARNHPAEQTLWALVGGEERGPLLDHASSVEIVEVPRGFEAVFVRKQALWRAASADGLSFGLARPLRDERGPIEAFDPAVLRLPDGRLRLYAAELAGDDRAVDPATHATRIVSWTGPDLDTLLRDPGVRFEGIGLVDPFVAPPGAGDPRWALYVTEARSRIVRATSPDGDRFAADPTFRADGLTVPLVVDGGLVAQLQVMGWSVLAWRPLPDGATRLLEVCGTGPALAAGRLYYTRAAEPCPEPIALPARRPALGTLLRSGATSGRDHASEGARSADAPAPR